MIFHFADFFAVFREGLFCWIQGRRICKKIFSAGLDIFLIILFFPEQVNKLTAEVEKLSKDANIYKTSSAEIQIKLDTLQQYFKQQETELHRYG